MDRPMEKAKGKKHKMRLFRSCLGMSQRLIIKGNSRVTSTKQIKAAGKNKVKLKGNTNCFCVCWKTGTANVRTVPVNVTTSSEITLVRDSNSIQHREPSRVEWMLLKDRKLPQHSDHKAQANHKSTNDKVGGTERSLPETIGTMRGDTTGKDAGWKGVIPPASSFGRDNVVGVSVVAATALMMVTCGEAWAVLISLVWLLAVTYFKSVAFRNADEGQNKPDFDSVEYKKNVVLQGLLHRARSTS